MLTALGALFVYSLVCTIIVQSVDPADIFKGAHQRPKLEILYPENGAILDSGKLEIKVNIKGYKFPSSFHDSSVCVGLSTGDVFLEECFVEAPDLKFHIDGLSADSEYSLRVIFFERGEAIAVSVRNFRVGGIKGLVSNNVDEIVTIQTAVQVALSYQLDGKNDEATRIYNTILSIDPLHPYTLHLLGLTSYQSGDIQGALPYLHKAIHALEQITITKGLLPSELQGYDGFHNSLGECYRVLQRYDEAEEQYLKALHINPHNILVKYNLAILYQLTNEWNHAILLYQSVVNGYTEQLIQQLNTTGLADHEVDKKEHEEGVDVSGGGENATDTISLEEMGTQASVAPPAVTAVTVPELNEVDVEIYLNAKIRECDLLQTLFFNQNLTNELLTRYMNKEKVEQPNQVIANCWIQGLQIFPQSHDIYNELGNLLLRVGQYADAVPLYRTAVSLGNTVAQVNLAHVLESMGHTAECRDSFQSLVNYAITNDYLPYTHFLLRLITVTPRVLPTLDSDIYSLRSKQLTDLDSFLALDIVKDHFYVDNSPPLHFGFYTGFYWTYQLNTLHSHPNATMIYDVAYSNANLKKKLYHAYVKYCPALLQGIFVNALGKQFPTHPSYDAADTGTSPNEANNRTESKMHNSSRKKSQADATAAEEGVHPDRNGEKQDKESHPHDTTTPPPPTASTASTAADVNDTKLEEQNYDDYIFKSQNPSYFRLLYTENDEVYLRMHAEGGVKIVNLASFHQAVTNINTVVTTTNTLNHVPYSSTIEFVKRRNNKNKYKQIRNMNMNIPPSMMNSNKKVNPIKIGFISRFFRVHAVGILMEGIIQKLSSDEDYEVHVFFVDGTTQALKSNMTSFEPLTEHKLNKYHDPVQINIVTHADFTYYLSTDISEISQFIRSLALDMVIYPEIGIDTICYFLAFTRLAPIQAAWIGHPDTTGIATIDYFITSDVLPEFIRDASMKHDIIQRIRSTTSLQNIPASFWKTIELPSMKHSKVDKKWMKQQYEQVMIKEACHHAGLICDGSMNEITTDGMDGSVYTTYAPALSTLQLGHIYTEEKVYMMRNLGTFFQDTTSDYVSLLTKSPRTSLLDRGKFIDYLHLPKTAHLLLLAQPLYKLHDVFDDTIAKILTQDRLAYVIVIDSVNVSSWQHLYINRLTDKYTYDVKERILFFITTTMEDTLTAMAAAHVLLDPFPVSGYLPTFQALSIGLPVITFPSNSLAGRMGLAMYNMIQYHELVCNSTQEYINKVHNITHNPKARSYYVNEILSRRHLLYNDTNALQDWKSMISTMMQVYKTQSNTTSNN